MKQYDKSEGVFRLALDNCLFIEIQGGSCFFPFKRSKNPARYAIELEDDSDVLQVEDEIRKPAKALCVIYGPLLKAVLIARLGMDIDT